MKTFDSWGSSVIADGVKGRRDAERLIAVDLNSALKKARAIRHPWYRCQAIAHVAAATSPVKASNALLLESLSAAYELEEPNRIVSVAAWPLSQIARIDPTMGHDVICDLLGTINREPHGLRKLDGLASILRTVSRVSTLRAQVLPAFLAAASASVGWRTERIVAIAADVLAEFDPETATALLASRTPNRFIRQARAKLTRRAMPLSEHSAKEVSP